MRCAEMTWASHATLNSAQASDAAFITGQSESLAMMIPTSGATAVLFFILKTWPCYKGLRSKAKQCVSKCRGESRRLHPVREHSLQGPLAARVSSREPIARLKLYCALLYSASKLT